MLEVDGLKVGYGDRVVIEELTLTVEGGEGVALRGPNGIGKSTVLRCVAGLLAPMDGAIRVDGERVDERSAAFRRAVAALLDSPAWYPGLSAREHLSLVRLANGPIDDGWFAEGELSERLGVDGFADASPSSLSSGQQQRLALAMVLDRPSRLLLLDEPERHLDQDGRALVAALVGEYLGRGGAALLASHDPTVTEGCAVVELGYDWYDETAEA
ncbi:ABC transporter ATP-binding protein [Dactylosporangium sp. NPDC000555]|uniref:ABC transporter ATP-binding protein n=1 Tax=Dactylosporangium sp. NPDC000555 TaxID=3154260 RepID=UPI00332F425F